MQRATRGVEEGLLVFVSLIYSVLVRPSHRALSPLSPLTTLTRWQRLTSDGIDLTG